MTTTRLMNLPDRVPSHLPTFPGVAPPLVTRPRERIQSNERRNGDRVSQRIWQAAFPCSPGYDEASGYARKIAGGTDRASATILGSHCGDGWNQVGAC